MMTRIRCPPGGRSTEENVVMVVVFFLSSDSRCGMDGSMPDMLYRYNIIVYHLFRRGLLPLHPPLLDICNSLLCCQFAFPVTLSNIKIAIFGIDRLCSRFNINPAYIFPLNRTE